MFPKKVWKKIKTRVIIFNVDSDIAIQIWARTPLFSTNTYTGCHKIGGS